MSTARLHTQDVDSLARKLDALIGLIPKARQCEAFAAIHVDYIIYMYGDRGRVPNSQ
jgi:hypothetical protein